jgi:hypothetical protein
MTDDPSLNDIALAREQMRRIEMDVAAEHPECARALAETPEEWVSRVADCNYLSPAQAADYRALFAAATALEQQLLPGRDSASDG